jgi:haloalkane dehalogenase
MNKEQIPSEFPFKSNFVEINGSLIHYIDESAINSVNETVFLFLHGNPTSSYLWRNIILTIVPNARSIAPDLIGFGKSGKPEIEYNYEDHYQFITSFIETLQLKNIVLVLHDWGGAIGFRYAMTHPDNVKGLVFMETFCKPLEWASMDLLSKWLFKQLRDSASGDWWNRKLNIFIKFILPFSIKRKLSKVEKKTYAEPFITLESRKPITRFPIELPFKGENTQNEKIATDYYNFLKATEIPKLLLYAKPGALIKEKDVKQFGAEFTNLTSAYIGTGLHYIQEDQPGEIAKEILLWYNSHFC